MEALKGGRKVDLENKRPNGGSKKGIRKFKWLNCVRLGNSF
jgi:hypothetical protein